MELKDSLRQLREQHHWKQTELARILGIKRSTYTYYETGKTEPPLSRLLLLSKIYNVSLDTLVGRDQEDGEGGVATSGVVWEASSVGLGPPSAW